MAEPGRLDRRLVLDEALRAGVIRRPAHAVACGLNDYADRRGVLRGLSYAELGGLLGRSPPTIKRAVVELCATGVLLRLQTGRGLRRAAYLVAPQSVRGNLRGLRVVPWCGQNRPQPRDSRQVKRKSPAPLTPPGCPPLTLRHVELPDTLWRLVQARGPLPEGLDEQARRELCHLVAATCRRVGRRRGGASLARWRLESVPVTVLPRWATDADRLEAQRTLRDAEQRERLRQSEQAARSAAAATPRTSEPRREQRAAESLLRPALPAAELGVLERLNAELVRARERAGLSPGARAGPCIAAAVG